MSSSPGIEWALDKVAELAGVSVDGDAFEVLLGLVGALEPPPEAGTLEPAARRVGRLRLAEALDRPGDLRLGAARLLAALDAPAPETGTSGSESLPEPLPEEEMANDQPASEPPREGANVAGRPSSRAAKRRVILSFPTSGSAVEPVRLPARVVTAPYRNGDDENAAHRNGDDEPASPQPAEPLGTISGPHTARVGSTLSLNGSAPPGDGPVTVEGSYDGGDTWETLSSVESSHGRYTAQVSLDRRGELQMRVVFADASSAEGSITVR